MAFHFDHAFRPQLCPAVNTGAGITSPIVVPAFYSIIAAKHEAVPDIEVEEDLPPAMAPVPG